MRIFSLARDVLRRSLLAAFQGSYLRSVKTSRRLMPRGRLLLCLLTVLLVLSLDPSRNGPRVALLVCLGVVCAFCAAHLLLPLKRLSFMRRLPDRVVSGEPFSYSLRVENPSRFSFVDLQVRDYGLMRYPDMSSFREQASRFPGLDSLGLFDKIVGYYQWLWMLESSQEVMPDEFFFPVVPPKGHVEITGHAVSLRRGRRRFSAVSVGLPDPVHLFRRLRAYPAQDVVVCWPAPVRVDSVSVRMDGVVSSELSGAPASGIDDSGEIRGLRSWRHGDLVRNVDWKASAKSGELLARERAPVVDPLLFLVFVPSGRPDADEYLASVCHGLLLDADRLGFGACADHNSCAPLSGGLGGALDVLALSEAPKERVEQASGLLSVLLEGGFLCKGAVLVHASFDADFSLSVKERLSAAGLPSVLLPVDVPGDEHDAR